jgi:hypothetical protein
MSITYGDHLIDIGYYDITPEQEREIEAREECARRGLDPDEICADGGVTAWMVVNKDMREERRDPLGASLDVAREYRKMLEIQQKRIEQLEAALREIVAWDDDGDRSWSTMRKIARAALDQKAST